MWWISILINLLIVIISVVICIYSYKKTADVFFLETMRLHGILYGNALCHQNNFSNIYANVILKFVITCVCIIIIHFSDSLWISYIYILYLLLSYRMFNMRKKEFNSLQSEEKALLKPAFNITILIPVIHTLFYISLFLTYFLNK